MNLISFYAKPEALHNPRGKSLSILTRSMNHLSLVFGFWWLGTGSSSYLKLWAFFLSFCCVLNLALLFLHEAPPSRCLSDITSSTKPNCFNRTYCLGSWCCSWAQVLMMHNNSTVALLRFTLSHFIFIFREFWEKKAAFSFLFFNYFFYVFFLLLDCTLVQWIMSCLWFWLRFLQVLWFLPSSRKHTVAFFNRRGFRSNIITIKLLYQLLGFFITIWTAVAISQVLAEILNWMQMIYHVVSGKWEKEAGTHRCIFNGLLPRCLLCYSADYRSHISGSIELDLGQAVLVSFHHPLNLWVDTRKRCTVNSFSLSLSKRHHRNSAIVLNRQILALKPK